MDYTPENTPSLAVLRIMLGKCGISSDAIGRLCRVVATEAVNMAILNIERHETDVRIQRRVGIVTILDELGVCGDLIYEIYRVILREERKRLGVTRRLGPIPSRDEFDEIMKEQ